MDKRANLHDALPASTSGPRARSVTASEIGRALGFGGVGENAPARLASGGFLCGIGATATATAIRPGPALARHAGGHVFAAFTAQAHGGKRAAPAIARMGLHAHALVQRQGDERLPCLRAAALAAFGRVHALQTQLPGASARIGAHPERVAICHPRDRTLPGIGMGADGNQQQEGSGKKARQKHHGVKRGNENMRCGQARAVCLACLDAQIWKLSVKAERSRAFWESAHDLAVRGESVQGCKTRTADGLRSPSGICNAAERLQAALFAPTDKL